MPDRLAADRFTRDLRLVPPEALVVPTLGELLAGRLGGDVLIDFSIPRVRGSVLGTDVVAGELDEDTLDERYDRPVTPVVGDVESKTGL